MEIFFSVLAVVQIATSAAILDEVTSAHSVTQKVVGAEVMTLKIITCHFGFVIDSHKNMLLLSHKITSDASWSLLTGMTSQSFL